MKTFIWICVFFTTACKSVLLTPVTSNEFEKFEDRRYKDDDDCGFPTASLFKQEDNKFSICKQPNESGSALGGLCDTIVKHSDSACRLAPRGFGLTEFPHEFVGLADLNVRTLCNTTLFRMTTSRCIELCSTPGVRPVCNLYLAVEKVISFAIFVSKDFKVLKDIWKEFDFKYPPTSLMDMNEPLNICEKNSTTQTTHELCNNLTSWAYYIHYSSKRTALQNLSPIKVLAKVYANISADWNPCDGFVTLSFVPLKNRSSCDVICNQPIENLAVCKALYYGIQLWQNAKNDIESEGSGGKRTDDNDTGTANNGTANNDDSKASGRKGDNGTEIDGKEGDGMAGNDTKEGDDTENVVKGGDGTGKDGKERVGSGNDGKEGNGTAGTDVKEGNDTGNVVKGGDGTGKDGKERAGSGNDGKDRNGTAGTDVKEGDDTGNVVKGGDGTGKDGKEKAGSGNDGKEGDGPAGTDVKEGDDTGNIVKGGDGTGNDGKEMAGSGNDGKEGNDTAGTDVKEGDDTGNVVKGGDGTGKDGKERAGSGNDGKEGDGTAGTDVKEGDDTGNVVKGGDGTGKDGKERTDSGNERNKEDGTGNGGKEGDGVITGAGNVGLQLDDEEEEQSVSNHFVAYFLTAMVLCVAGYIMFHNKQKILAFIIEGRTGREGRRPQTKEYHKLKTTAEDVMPSLEKSTTASNYVF